MREDRACVATLWIMFLFPGVPILLAVLLLGNIMADNGSPALLILTIIVAVLVVGTLLWMLLPSSKKAAPTSQTSYNPTIAPHTVLERGHPDIPDYTGPAKVHGLEQGEDGGPSITWTVQEAPHARAKRQATTLRELQNMHPVAFEAHVAELFRGLGYSAKLTVTSGDEGVDIVLRRDSQLAVVQCKRYSGTVGQPVVRDLYGAIVHAGADEGFVVTTGTYSLPARKWAKGKPLTLVDGQELVNWEQTAVEQERLDADDDIVTQAELGL